MEPILIDIPEMIDGPRVRLRPFRLEDAHDIWEAIEESRAALEPWMPWAHGDHSIDSSRLFLARAAAQWLLRESLQMAIFDRDTGRFLGNAGFPRLDWEVPSFEIGYWLRTSAEGYGFMQESVRLLTRMAFDLLKANRVEIRVDPRNLRSCNVARRLGYPLEGTLRNCAPDGYGRPSDRHVFALTPEDYRRLDWAH